MMDIEAFKEGVDLTDEEFESFLNAAKRAGETDDLDDTTRALAVIRQSQSSRSESASLSLQRDEIPQLAEEHAEEVEEIDLGVHTGFSIHFKEGDDERIDANEDVLRALRDVRAGKYDYIVSWDDTRLARDPFFWEWVRAAKTGGAEFLFYQDLPDIDSLEFRVRRVVEQDVKQREIQKSKEVLEDRKDKGYDQGRPPKGLKFDSEGQYWVPDEEFEDVLEVIEMYEDGSSYTDLEEKTGYSRTTISKILNERRDLYEKKASEHGFEVSA